MKINILNIVTLGLLAVSCTCAHAVTDTDTASRIATTLIPKPVSQQLAEGYFTVSASTGMQFGEGIDAQLSGYFKDIIEGGITGRRGYPGNLIVFSIDTAGTLPGEGYTIQVTEDTVRVKGADRAGIFYAMQTLLQLLPSDIYAREELPAASIPCQIITDYPQYGYRGAMLDVARTFSDKETVLKFIDRMSRHKLNRLHWHLTDDEGWRIELESYPELAAVGGYRGGDSPVLPIYGQWEHQYGGYFTKEDIREIVAYAQLRNVEIIPEIDLPGHSRAAAKVFPHILCRGSGVDRAAGDDRRNVWCTARESNYQMLEAILGEVAELFPSQYFHIGADEVMLGQWRSCPDCQSLMRQQGYNDAKRLTDHFVGRLCSILEKYGKRAVVWNEAAESGVLPRKHLVSGWEGIRQVRDALAKGYTTVVMPGKYFYIDMRQSPDEDGQVWAGVVTARRLYEFDFVRSGIGADNLQNVAGFEAAFFSELYVSHDHSYLDYMTYPRLCALAERAWTADANRSWDDFYDRLTGYHLDRLDAMGIGYRVFAAETDYRNGMITAQPPFEGVEIRYTDDRTEPTRGSMLYTSPIETCDPANYRFRTFYRNAAGPSVPASAKVRVTVAPGRNATATFNLADIATGPGLWYLRIHSNDDDLRIARIYTESDGNTSNIIGSTQRVNELHRMRVNVTDRNRNGILHAVLRNEGDYPSEIIVELERLPYIQPAVRVESSMKENTRFPFSNAADYNFSTYSRTTATCRKGDHITYTFTEPVDAESIEVCTGLYYMPRYLIISGRVQVSTDGRTFTDAARLDGGRAVIAPGGRIKAIRIVADQDGNSENAVAFQDLKITPRR